MSLYNDLNSVLTPYANKIKQNEFNIKLALSLEGGGAPTVVGSISEMTDTEQIYVLSTDGNWYYHNGTTWVSGGEYGAVATDTTLTQSGIPADAKKVGDELTDIKADLGDLDDRIEALEQGEGGTIVEKTVSGGAVVTVTDGAAGYPIKALTAEIATPSSGSAPSYTGANLYSSGADTSNPTVVPISWETEAGAVCGGTLEINSDGSADLTVSWGKITISDIRVEDINKSYGNPTLWFIKWYYLTNKKKVGTNNVFSPQWTLDSSGVSENLADLSMACSVGTTYNYVYFRDDRYTTGQDFFNAHKDDVLIYEYAEPVAYHLASVDSIETITGLNKIWTNIGNITSLTYSAFVEEGEISVDPTLSNEGDAADAAATGEAIRAVDTKVEAIRTATESDAGKALKAKTITSGKVTEWEFGETSDAYANTNAESVDLDIVDESGNVLVRFSDGHVKTKNFDSSEISEEIEDVLAGKWTGKKWTCVGDSLTEANHRTTLHYHDYIAQRTGITVVNKGVSGTGYMSGVNDNRSFIARVATVPTDSDVVTIFGSCNDRMLTLGTIADTGTSTVCGCINKTLDDLFTRMPTCNLGVITPTPIKGNSPSNDNSTMSLYSAALVEICRKRSIPCLDLFHCSGLRPDDPTAEAATYSKDDGNGVHPDEAGHAIIATKIEAFLETLM